MSKVEGNFKKIEQIRGRYGEIKEDITCLEGDLSINDQNLTQKPISHFSLFLPKF